MKRKDKSFSSKSKILLLLLLLLPLTQRMYAFAASGEDGVWRTTIIIKTLDGGKAEYLIDRDTRVSIEQPNLVIETDGMVLTYALESMKQVSYGRKLIPLGISSPSADGGKTVSMEKEMLFLSGLPNNTLVGVYNAEGKALMNCTYSGDAQVSMQGLPTGVYFVKFNNETYKILKK